MMRFYYGSRARSVPEYLRLRFDEKTRGLNAMTFAVMTIFSSEFTQRSPWNFAIWIGWLVAAYFVYRHAIRDLYVLAGGALSVIVVAAALLGKALPMRDAGEFLFIGLVVIALSAAAGWWLRMLAAENAA